MVSSRLSVLLVAAVVFSGCGGGAPAPTPPAAATSPVAAGPTPPPAASATAVAEAEPAPETWTDAEAMPSVAELDPGARAAAAKNWVEARKELGAGLEKIRGSAPLDEVLAGQALLGRACAQLGDAKCAEDAYGAVVSAWRGAETAKTVQDAAGSDGAARKARLHRALFAVGEALFFAAEQKRHALESVRVPAYEGAKTREAIRAHIDGKIIPWIKQKQQLVEETEAAYEKIAALEPAPPRWGVDASARVGMAWARFVAELRAAPIPREWVHDAETRTAYYQALDDASKPQRKRARAAFEKCLSDANEVGYRDELSKHCEAWLAKQP